MGQTMSDLAREQFASLFNAYPDDVYFPIVRNYLGNIRTPFSKRDLTRSLTEFLARPSVQQHLTDLLDDDDLKVLTAVKLFGPVGGKALACLFPQISYPERIRRLSLLVARLWLVKQGDALSLNPLLEPLAKPYLNLSVLFGPPEPGTEGFTATRDVLKGYLSLAYGRKRPVEDAVLKEAFPACPDTLRQTFFGHLSGTLAKAGLLVDGAINFAHVETLCSQDSRTMLASLLSVDSGVSLHAMRRLLEVLSTLGSLRADTFPLVTALLTATGSEPFPDRMEETLCAWGVIQESDGILHIATASETKRSPLVIDSDRTIGYSGSTPVNDILWRFATLVKLDVRTVYQISQESFFRALDSGLRGDMVRSYLADNGAKPALLDELSLEEERYREAQLFHGIILKADERVSRLVEQIPALSQAILQRLSAGVFLMDGASYPLWSKALKDGLGFLPALQGEPFTAEEAASPSSEQEPTEEGELPDIPRTLPPKTAVFDEALRTAIQKQGMDNAIRTALTLRFQDKLLVDVCQTRDNVVDDTHQAGGFDYQGKVALLRHALSLKNTLLFLQVDQEELLAQPMALSKSTDGQMLLKVNVLPAGQTRIIPVGKIFLVRMGRMYISL